MTLSVPESVTSIYIEKRRQLLYEVSPFALSFFVCTLYLQTNLFRVGFAYFILTFFRLCDIIKL